MRKLLSNIYYRGKRQVYLIQKLAASFTKPTIIYTKWHPIYTSVFEDDKFESYNAVYINVNGEMNALERMLLAKSVLIHADAANFPKSNTGKRIIVECEGNPKKSFFENPDVKSVLIESQSALTDKTYADKVTLCYPAIDVKQGGKLRESKEHITLLSVGHGGYIKGYDVLYRIYKELSKKYKIKLIIAGTLGHDFDCYPEVLPESYARENFDTIQRDLANDPNVTVKSYRREELLRDVYPQSDIYVQFSRMETFGYAILEAMSFGLPIVSCRFRAIKEMVQHGENGFLVQSNGIDERTNNYVVDINDTAWGNNCYEEGLDYIVQLIDDKSKIAQYGSRSQEMVKEKFSIAHKRNALSLLYENCIT